MINKITIYSFIGLVLLSNCQKENTNKPIGKLIHRYIVNEDIYEYNYNNNKLVRIKYPSGAICNLDYGDSLITYKVIYNDILTEHGYYKINNYWDVILQCSYKDNDTVYTKFEYNENRNLKKDSTWNGLSSSFNMYNYFSPNNSVSFDSKNLREIEKTTMNNLYNNDYSNYIDWRHFGMTLYGIPSDIMPIGEDVYETWFDCSPDRKVMTFTNNFTYSTNYSYEFDSKNRIIKRKEYIEYKYPNSKIDSTIIKIEYYE